MLQLPCLVLALVAGSAFASNNVRIQVAPPEPSQAIPIASLARAKPHVSKVAGIPKPNGSDLAPVWASVTPEHVFVPILSIGLKRSDGKLVDLYVCREADMEDCQVDVANDSEGAQKLLNSTLPDVVEVGTYTEAYVRTCGKADAGYEGRVQATVFLGGKRYVTREGSFVPSADEDDEDEAELVPFPGKGCKRDFTLVQPMMIDGVETPKDKAKLLHLLFSKDDIAWAAIGGSATRQAWDPASCIGRKKENGPFLCVSPPDLGVTLADQPSDLKRERYQITGGALYTLFISGDQPISAVARPFYEVGAQPLRGFTAKKESFPRKDTADAVRLKDADAKACKGKPAPVIRYPLDLVQAPIVPASLLPYGLHDGNGATGHVEGHAGLDLDTQAQVDVSAPFDGKLLAWRPSEGGSSCAALATDDHCFRATICGLKQSRPAGPLKAGDVLGRNLTVAGGDPGRFKSHFEVSTSTGGPRCPAAFLDPEVVRCKFGKERGEDKPEDCSKTPVPAGGTYLSQATHAGLKERKGEIVHCRPCTKAKAGEPEPLPGVDCTALPDEVPQVDGPQIRVNLPVEPLLCGENQIDSGVEERLEQCLMLGPQRPVL